MARVRLPTLRDIRALVAFLPRHLGDGTRLPVVWWSTEIEDGALAMPQPEKGETVESFFEDVTDHPITPDGFGRQRKRSPPATVAGRMTVVQVSDRGSLPRQSRSPARGPPLRTDRRWVTVPRWTMIG